MRGYNTNKVFMSEDDAARWADSWGLSDELACAILEMCEDMEAADALYTDPTPEQRRRIEQRAWELADDEETELYWGDTTIYRDGSCRPS